MVWDAQHDGDMDEYGFIQLERDTNTHPTTNPLRGRRAMPVLLRVLFSRGLVPAQPNIRKVGRQEEDRWYYCKVKDRDTGEDRGERWFRPDENAINGWDVRKVRP